MGMKARGLSGKVVLLSKEKEPLPKGATGMENNVMYVGLDYHQDRVQVCAMNPAGQVLANRSCANDWQAIRRVIGPSCGPVRAAIEACSGASDLAEELVAQAGWSVDLAHPGYVARIKQSPDKTDWGDAQLLSDLERVGYLPRVWLAPQAVRELRQLVRYRQGVAQERRNLKLRVRALLREQRLRAPSGMRPWGPSWLAWLQGQAALSEEGRWIVARLLMRLKRVAEELAAAELRLAERTRSDAIVGRLMAIKGIGLVTACTLRAEIGRFERFRSGKQLSRFCGLSPRNASSGQRQADAGLIDACNKALRAVIIEAAHRLMRYDPRWSRLAHQLRQAGKAVSVVVAAVANRWMRWLWQQMKQDAGADVAVA
jgi:transposase